MITRKDITDNDSNNSKGNDVINAVTRTTQKTYILFPYGNFNKGFVRLSIGLRGQPYNNIETDKEILDTIRKGISDIATLYTESEFEGLYDKYLKVKGKGTIKSNKRGN